MDSKFKFSKGTLNGISIIETNVFNDERGFFYESYNKKEFESGGIVDNFIQDNLSFSLKNVLRGLHFQKPPHETSKLIRCIKGEIFDVAVDLRRGSKTFGKWESIILSGANKKIFYVPKGFAHGFCVLSDSAKIFYKVSDFYYPECDSGVKWNDPDLKVSWPVKDPIISGRDKNLPFLNDLRIAV